MGRRAQDRDEDRAGRGAPVAVERPKEHGLQDHVLGLQRDYGNAAVTTIVQRRPKDRPASTDARGAKKRKVAPKAPAIENLAPTEANPKYANTDNTSLTEKAAEQMKSDVKNALYWAAEMLEERWFRTKNKGDSRAVAMNLMRVYAKLGDTKHAKFWELVHTGQFDPRAPVQEDMTGKEF